MKHLIGWCVLAVLTIVSSPARADDPGAPKQGNEPQPEVLIPRNARNGGWGGPVVQVSTLRDRAAVFVGGRGGWLVGGRLTIGGGAFGLTSRGSASSRA